jgi:uncharacterized UBP type Zn finger protein
MLLSGMGFGDVEIKKALFLSGGAYSEAVNWLVQHRNIPSVSLPWNVTSLQVSVLFCASCFVVVISV